MPRSLPTAVSATLATVFLVGGCQGTTPAALPLPRVSAPVPGVTLPPDPLLPLVPSPSEVPPGMVPLLVSTGPRDVTAIASFSGNPAAAATALRSHHFHSAYVAQYADPASGRTLSVVVSQFADTAGAAKDYAGDVAGSGGAPVPGLAPVGEASDVRSQPLPAKGKVAGQLVTVRFRVGRHTWLVAYGATPTADPQAALDVARTLAARGR